MAISVAMAVYNGECYLSDQLDSVLNQLNDRDEVIISLDPSQDNTEFIIKEYCRKDSRIRLCRGPGKGVVYNFENALRHCRNEIIFLADQDDIWKPNKVEEVVRRFDDKKVMVVVHDAEIVDERLRVQSNSFLKMKNGHAGIIHNIVKNSYIGCCMAFRRRCLKKILPFPSNIPMHDQWIGVLCEWFGKAEFINEPLLLYRRHGNNLSDMRHSSLKQMLIWRMVLIRAFVYRIFSLN